MATGHASSSALKRAKRSISHQLQLSFPFEELRDRFLTRLEHAKKLLFPRKSVDNAQFMNALLTKLNSLESQSVDGMQQQQQQQDEALPCASILDSSVSLLHIATYH